MPRFIDLESALEVACRQSGLSLSADLRRIRDAAFQIWDSPRLVFFTDHKAQTHSKSITRLLGHILGELQQDPNQRLNEYELFVLLAACYLHDIGMQDFRVGGRSMDQFTQSDYELIRRRHPERSKELIVTGILNLDGNPFTLPALPATMVDKISLVAQAHGSEYFDETVEKLQMSGAKPGNLPFRGDLLAGLLMIGDELHLHEERAVSPQIMDISPLSSLHFHVNQYVTGVDVVPQKDGTLRIRLSMEFPTTSGTYREAVKDWIRGKLVPQVRRVNPILRAATKGLLLFEERVQIRDPVETTQGLRRALPSGAEALLMRDIYQRKTVDREDLLTALRAGLVEARTACTAFLIRDTPRSDWPFLLRKLQVDLRAEDGHLVVISLDVAVAHSAFDVLLRIQEQLSRSGFVCSRLETETRAPRRVLQDHLKALVNDLGTLASTTVLTLVLDHPDRADDITRMWLKGSFLPALHIAKIRSRVVVVVDEGDPFADEMPFRLREFHLQAYSLEDLIAHSRARCGYTGDEARTRADRIYSFAMNGTPEAVLLGLEVETRQEIVG